jgi:hypothetical protein
LCRGLQKLRLNELPQECVTRVERSEVLRADAQRCGATEKARSAAVQRQGGAALSVYGAYQLI